MWSWREETARKQDQTQGRASRWQWEELGEPICLYSVLRVSPGVSPRGIKQAYRLLARRMHPDLRCSAERDAAGREMAALNLAYSVLADPDRRAAYDREHNVG